MKKHLLRYALAFAAIATTASISAANLTLTAQPAGGEVRSLGTVTVSATLENSDENVLAVNPDKLSAITLTKDGGEAVACSSATTDFDAWPMNKVILSFGSVTEAGTYTLHIPAGTVTESNASTGTPVFGDADNANADFSAVYTVNPDLKLMDAITADPADKSTVTEIQDITLVFDKLPNNIGYALAYDESKPIALSNGTTTVNASSVFCWNNAVMVGFDEAITEEGDWTVTLPAAAFSYDGELSPELTLNYTINSGWNADGVRFDPVNGSNIAQNTEYATKVTLTFNAEVVRLVDADGSPTAFQVSYAGKEVTRYTSMLTALQEGGYYISSYEDNELQFFFGPTLFERLSELTIHSDAGDFTVDDKPSPAINYSITVGDVHTYTYTFTPAAGSDVKIEDLSEILITFPDAATAEKDENAFYGILRTANWISPGCTVEAVEGAEHPTFSLKFDITQTTPDRYSLRLGEGSFILDGNQLSPEIEASWTVTKDASEVSTDWTPSPTGKITNESYGINGAIVFDAEELLSYGENYSQIEAYFNDEKVADFFGWIEGSAYMFTVADPYLGQAGTFRLSAPAGAFSISGVASEAIDYTWEVVLPREYTWTLTPAEGSTVGSLAEVTIEFADAETVALTEYSRADLRKKDYSYFGSSKVVAVEGAEHPTFKLSFDPAPSTDGEYTLSFGYSTFLFDGAQSSDSKDVKYTLDTSLGGIEDVVAGAAASTFDIYTIDGRCIAIGAEASALHSLAPGFYIVNGQKLLVK